MFPIIATRTVQVGGAAVVALLALRGVLPPDRFRRIVPVGGVAVSAGLSAYFLATFAPRLPLGAPLLARLPENTGDAVALTFDDGPHPETTPEILDVLAAHGARATFFVLGEQAARHPELVRRIVGEAHTLGIHALRHRAMVLQSAREIADDLRQTRHILEDAAPGGGVRYFRPPHGFKTVTLGRVATRLGLRVVGWSLDPRDYDPLTPGEVVTRVRARLRPGDVVLLHERPGARHTLDALPDLLALCARRGLRCVALE